MNPRSEPVAISAGIIAFVQAVLIAVTALGLWSLSDIQQAALMGVVTTGVALGGAIVVRRQVTPNAAVEQAVEAARGDEPPKHLAED